MSSHVLGFIIHTYYKLTASYWLTSTQACLQAHGLCLFCKVIHLCDVLMHTQLNLLSRSAYYLKKRSNCKLYCSSAAPASSRWSCCTQLTLPAFAGSLDTVVVQASDMYACCAGFGNATAKALDTSNYRTCVYINAGAIAFDPTPNGAEGAEGQSYIADGFYQVWDLR